LVRVQLHHLVITQQRQRVRKAAVGREYLALPGIAGALGALAGGQQSRMVSRHLRVEAPHVIGIRDAEERVEAVTQRREVGMVAQVPLAQHGRRVALLFERFGDRDLVGM